MKKHVWEEMTEEELLKKYSYTDYLKIKAIALFGEEYARKLDWEVNNEIRRIQRVG